jgi:ribosomal protein L37AE/L43A
MTDRYMDRAVRREQDRMAREEARIEAAFEDLEAHAQWAAGMWRCEECGAQLDDEERCVERCDEGDRIDAIMERFGLWEETR